MKKITPFHIRGEVRFPWRPTADRAFIFPCPPPTTFVPGGLIQIPEVQQSYYFQGIGVLLAIGSGFFDDKGKWHGVAADLVPGMYVKYNQDVPWRHVEEAPDGKRYPIILCGCSDISGAVDFEV